MFVKGTLFWRKQQLVRRGRIPILAETNVAHDQTMYGSASNTGALQMLSLCRYKGSHVWRPSTRFYPQLVVALSIPWGALLSGCPLTHIFSKRKAEGERQFVLLPHPLPTPSTVVLTSTVDGRNPAPHFRNPGMTCCPFYYQQTMVSTMVP